MRPSTDSDPGGVPPPDAESWLPIPDGSGFGLANLPFGVATVDGAPQVVCRVGDWVLALVDVVPDADRHLFDRSDLNAFLAAGPAWWRDVRARLHDHLLDRANDRPLPRVDEVALHLPVTVRDYVDFYASIDHATNVGRLFRPDGEPLLPNWRHLPVAYHGRAGTVAVSGTPVRRPTGLVAVDGGVARRPSEALDFELEVGFVVGPGNEPGRPIAPDDADRHVFGVVLVNDWSARDLQAFEYQPLGPFLGKSFLTTVSPWVVPLAALAPHLGPGPEQQPVPDAGLATSKPWALDVALTAEVEGTEVCHTNLRTLYWTFAQQLAHLTSNGATTGPGDLFASGTVSGPAPGEQGCLLEATANGATPIRLAGGAERTWLRDGDTVTLRGRAGTGHGPVIDLGECTGTVVPAPDGPPPGAGPTRVERADHLAVAP
jgi:fumarylacetoacetase